MKFMNTGVLKPSLYFRGAMLRGLGRSPQPPDIWKPESLGAKPQQPMREFCKK